MCAWLVIKVSYSAWGEKIGNGEASSGNISNLMLCFSGEKGVVERKVALLVNKILLKGSHHNVNECVKIRGKVGIVARVDWSSMGR